MTERVRVVLVFGGESAEHGVSCLTAASVMAAIDTDRYEVSGIGITRDGQLIRYTAEQIAGLVTVDRTLPEVSAEYPTAVLMRVGDGCEVATLVDDRLIDRQPVDVAFALIHGPFGEDGTIQGLFEIFGLRYVGSGVTGSAAGMDKVLMKQVLTAHDLPVGPYVAVPPRRWQNEPDKVREEVARLNWPVFVKPARGGSSMGITRVTAPDQLDDAIAHAREFDPKVIVEQGFVGAREIECAVLGDLDGGPARTTRVGEIVMHTESGFYDFDAKYLPEDQVTLQVPTEVSEDVLGRARELARRAFEAFDGEGLARVDFFLDGDELFINELNTMPGFTEFSMYPMLWQDAGLSYSELISTLIELARARPLGLR
ncbi:D-alanine--D-alanine ligase family protein [Enemella sp. A6]|uniref:D-alanine--D-alanine ligase family protein n=1 Tax=Enemella sp. A6 TaxID=3440152 RepID=UPI003EBCB5E6